MTSLSVRVIPQWSVNLPVGDAEAKSSTFVCVNRIIDRIRRQVATALFYVDTTWPIFSNYYLSQLMTPHMFIIVNTEMF